MFLEPVVCFEFSVACFTSDVSRCYCVFHFHVHPISFHSFQYFLALFAGFFENSLFENLFRWVFFSNMQLERFFPVENFFTFITFSPSYSPHDGFLWIVMSFVVFSQIIVAFGSVWTKWTEEAGLRHVGIHVRPQQSFLAELFRAHITDEGFLVR